MNLTPHFTLAELTASATATKKKIDNTPTATEQGHLQCLAAYLLEPLRVAWGSPITVTSGYRGPKLNTSIGGAKKSAHLQGYAADIVPQNGDIKRFKRYVRDWLIANDVAFDQYIDERNTAGSEWVHLGLISPEGTQRRQFLATLNGKDYTPIIV